MGRIFYWLGVLVYVFRSFSLEAQSPSVLYLTWMHDPTTTMTVQWHSDDPAEASAVSYHKRGETGWSEQTGGYAPLPSSRILVHTVELDGLEPDTLYEFRLGERGSQSYSFRTLPASLTRPVKFVIGGDAYFYLSTFRKMNAQIAAQDPDFVIVGGDIAYTQNSRAVFKGKGWELSRWRRFFKEWKEQMVTSDGRLIPLVPVIGNHDIKQTTLSTKGQHYLFYELFALPEKGVSYRGLDVGDYLSLFLLDTGHSYHIEGQQTQWLDKQLSSKQLVPYKMAVYHVGAYPSVYPFYGSCPKKIRAYWSPLFERYQLQAAFEHHNHAYKRSFPMKQGAVHPDGVLYMGDGSWGVSARKPKEMWYLEKSAQVNAVNVITLTSEKGKVEALNIKGEKIDSVGLLPTQREVSWNEGRWLRYD